MIENEMELIRRKDELWVKIFSPAFTRECMMFLSLIKYNGILGSDMEAVKAELVKGLDPLDKKRILQLLENLMIQYARRYSWDDLTPDMFDMCA